MGALGLPATFSVAVCRFGMTAADDCCPGRTGADQPEERAARVAGQGCCTRRVVDLGTPVAEHSREVASARPWVVPDDSLFFTGDHVGGPAPSLLRPSARAVGPPLRLLKQSFLI